MPWLPDLGQIARWGASVVDEVGGLPETLADLRGALLGVPQRPELLVRALERTTDALDRALPELTRAIAIMGERVDHVDRLAPDLAVELTRTAASLERILPEVSSAVGGMDSRVRNLDTTISELGKLVFGVIDVIPGARRVLRRSDSSGE